MQGTWDDILQLSIVHFMLYPDTQSGTGSILDSISRLAFDDFFSVLEVTWIKDAAIRKAVRQVAENSHISLAYGAQPILLSRRLDLNSLSQAERIRAVDQVKSCIEEAYELGATRLSVLSGPDPGERQRAEASKMLLGSLNELCAYGESRDVAITLETFDRTVEKRCLAGPAVEVADLAKAVRKDYDSFGIMYDMAHAPLLNENPKNALALLKKYLVHVHVGNCVKLSGHPAYGDKHPRFGIEGGEHDTNDLARFLEALFDTGYLGKRPRQRGELPIVGFEVKPLPEENPEAVIASTKRVWRRAWAKARLSS